MNWSRGYIGAAGFLSMLIAAGFVFAGENATPKPLWVSAPITIDAQGRAWLGKIVGANGILAERVRADLSEASYLPASSDGKPVASKMHVRAKIVLTPLDGDDYALKVEDINLDSMPRKTAPPRYPVEMARRGESGFVSLELTVAGDGRVMAAKTVEATDPVFSKEALAVARGWRLEPSSVDGSRFEYVITQPIWSQASKSHVPPKFACRWDERRPRWSQQVKRGCLDLLTIQLQMRSTRFHLVQ